MAPKVKVAGEWVNRAQSLEQIIYGRNSISKCVYEKLFLWVVDNLNEALSSNIPKNHFIGCLDIAGFEIFDFNSFEQLCINYTNEKLQQFFNWTTFIREQEEYQKEGIEWTTLDFKMDLSTTINLIEEPLGILSMLEEECMFPKASEKTFMDKLFQQNKKHVAMGKPTKKSKGQKDSSFELYHYAGTVGYSVTGWLDKNKDPLNGSVIELFRESSNSLMADLWKDYKTPEEQAEIDKQSKKKKKGKGQAFITVSETHRLSLCKLVSNLKQTNPHFIRCIVPNENKQFGVVDSQFVLHQLRCNGVIEGIRICKKGFPGRMKYGEFMARYKVLNPNAVPDNYNQDLEEIEGEDPADRKVRQRQKDKEACEAILKSLDGIDQDAYRFGISKAFFGAGFISQLEQLRVESMKIWFPLNISIFQKLGTKIN